MRIFQSILLYSLILCGSLNAVAHEKLFLSKDLKGFSNFADFRSEHPLSRNFTSELRLTAILAPKEKEIQQGVVWHIFKAEAAPNGKLPLIATARGGTAVFDLNSGNYLVHAAFGYASAIKSIVLNRNTIHETIVLDAGGLKLAALFGEKNKLSQDKLRFSIFRKNSDSPHEKSLIALNIRPESITRLKSGTYHVVSHYDSTNAPLARFNVTVEAGKITEAVVQHRAAEVTLKLVREQGGEALADTFLSILTEFGDPVIEKAGSYLNIVLAEGKYTLVAKNRNRIYQRDFIVDNAQNEDIELLANENNMVDSSQGSGD